MNKEPMLLCLTMQCCHNGLHCHWRITVYLSLKQFVQYPLETHCLPLLKSYKYSHSNKISFQTVNRRLIDFFGTSKSIGINLKDDVSNINKMSYQSIQLFCSCNMCWHMIKACTIMIKINCIDICFCLVIPTYLSVL